MYSSSNLFDICRSLFWGSPLGRTGHRSVADGWTDAGRQPVNQPAAARTGILKAGRPQGNPGFLAEEAPIFLTRLVIGSEWTARA